jgi:hypothetical protein
MKYSIEIHPSKVLPGSMHVLRDPSTYIEPDFPGPAPGYIF